MIELNREEGGFVTMIHIEPVSLQEYINFKHPTARVPMTNSILGLSLDEVLEYIAYKNQEMGKHYRLPTIAELTKVKAHTQKSRCEYVQWGKSYHQAVYSDRDEVSIGECEAPSFRLVVTIRS